MRTTFSVLLLSLLLCSACTRSTQPADPVPDDQNALEELQALHNAVEAYIRLNIHTLSPVSEVLGGTFYVTDITWQSDGSAIVSYEDGHIALRAEAHTHMQGSEVIIDSFTMIEENPPPQKEEAMENSSSGSIIGMANPASVHCQEVGGTLRIENKPPEESQYGVCYFEDNRQCEEWALFRGDCPVGGVKVTGYITPAARYCAITGGAYRITGTEEEEQGTCTFKDGKMCDVWELWEGRCS